MLRILKRRKYAKKEFFMHKRYGFYSLCLIPFLTLLMASGFSWINTNFSVIGNRGGRRAAFLLWGAFTGNYFYLYTMELMELGGCRDRAARGFLFCALVLFVTAVGIPYLPEQVPGLSRWHVQISFMSPLFLAAAQIRFLIVLQKKYGSGFTLQWAILALLGAGSGILLFSIGIVSTLLEVYVTIGVCLYLRLLDHKLEYFISHKISHFV